ncbi:hypothetical protein QR680_011805 [Steinernema hermaphroditum]|uniref:LRAT domain-containing protein n=1 Tax=Steinernema hermaphroditum TaxID=289476 RepID=A0AA39LYP8_9BILA|nr:hypothetical protein QR680_011805 [Steinernema hermaphroditum]
MSKTWMPAEDLLPSLEVGDIIEFPQVPGVETRWGIYYEMKEAGRTLEMMVQLLPAVESRSPTIKFETLEVHDICRKNNSSDSKWIPFPQSKVVGRAYELYKQLRKGDYSKELKAILCSSEDFVTWCRYGDPDERRTVKANQRGPGYMSKYMSGRELATHLKVGDLLEAGTYLTQHWAVYVGEYMSRDHVIIHMNSVTSSGNSLIPVVQNVGLEGTGKSTKAQIVWTDLLQTEGTFRVNNSSDKRWPPLPSEEIKKRAIGKVEANKNENYSGCSNNCEHFVNWCRYDHSVSFQAKEASSFWSYLKNSIAC